MVTVQYQSLQVIAGVVKSEVLFHNMKCIYMWIKNDIFSQ